MKVTKVKAKHDRQDSTVTNLTVADAEEFNFDLWAKAVRQQMLSVLREKF
jgi:hypothetical protein